MQIFNWRINTGGDGESSNIVPHGIAVFGAPMKRPNDLAGAIETAVDLLKKELMADPISLKGSRVQVDVFMTFQVWMTLIKQFASRTAVPTPLDTLIKNSILDLPDGTSLDVVRVSSPLAAYDDPQNITIAGRFADGSVSCYYITNIIASEWVLPTDALLSIYNDVKEIERGVK